MKRVGLLAAWGRYPIVVAEELRRQGYDTYCLGVKDHADPELAKHCTAFDWVGVGKIGAARRFYRRHGVTHATMAGKIHKFQLVQPWAWIKHLPDWSTTRVFAHHFLLGTKDRKDDTLLSAVIEYFAQGGVTFAPATDFAPELLVKFGQLTRRAPSAAERKDAEFGWTMAKELGRLDIGQSVIVRGRAVIAVEAIEGTDKCIERAGQLCRGGSFTIAKVAKPQQDMRFDVPTIGVGTLETMVRAGASCLVIEAGRTIVLDEAEVVTFANRHKLAIIALDSTAMEGHAGDQQAA